MIRRHVGDWFYLISQNDHAHLSGRIAAHFGNAMFAPPDPREETVTAISMHDCGWPLHDEQPLLNRDGLPLDVFESPLTNSLRLWTAAAERAETVSPYVGLLVSLHVLGLSGFAATRQHSRQEVFELNRFQHAEIERQEALRRKLGLATDRPTRLGLSLEPGDPAEQKLRRNHGIVQIHDRLSLALCCTQLPVAEIENVVAKPGESPITLDLSRPAPTTVVVHPWPFDQPILKLSVPYRAVPARRYANLEEFHAEYAKATAGELELELSAQ